ncbi:GNAT family N-acetyltransferase [Actinomycetes bacterium KLBMP 9797]
MPYEGLTWGPLSAADAADVAGLAERCHAADGGVAEVTIHRYAEPGAITTGGRTASGALAASAVVRRVGERAVASGLVDPGYRSQGVGGRLLDWALGAASALTAGSSSGGAGESSGGAGEAVTGVTVETEALTPAAERLFASRGLRRVFAEDVMRFDLVGSEPPAIAFPPGVRLDAWSSETAGRFFAVYEAAFRDRPGFPGWPAERWVAWTAGDDEFRPQWSVLAVDGDADAGFVTCADGWIVQVGVRPEWRGRGLGAALVAEALRRMRDAGAGTALLDVNVNNPAGALYTRLGFTTVSRRAKFEPRGY